MKRIFAFAVTAALCTAMLAGCRSTESGSTSSNASSSAATAESAAESETIGMPNPWTEYTSMDELNTAAGSRLKKPAGLEISDEAFTALLSDYNTAQYTFTIGGAQYTLRTANTKEDISGVWKDGKTMGQLADESGDDAAFEVTSGESGTGLWSRWFDGDTQYSLYAEGASAEDYAAVKAALQ